MNHLKERTERNCLNCNAQVYGKYCHICGQENIDTKETVWHLVSHFFQDITHFDGKFFTTLKFLTFRPGFLSREYMAGRRASYLNPVRMYVFTSAFFFLIFFSFFKVDEQSLAKNINIDDRPLADINQMGSTEFADYTRKINRRENKADFPMTREQFKKYTDSTATKTANRIFNLGYKSKNEYDSLLASGAIHHHWFTRQLVYKGMSVNEKYGNNFKHFLADLTNGLLHSLPEMLFISLPLLALLLKLLYVRRKQFYYVDHAIFSIQLYIFVFIALLFIFGLDKIQEQLHWGLIKYLKLTIILSLFFYEYKAMRNFYRQRRGKTILKYFLLNLMFLITMVSLFVVFLFFSFFKI